MTLIVGASAHGSPGVTTSLKLIAAQWPAGGSSPILVEADSSGGTLAVSEAVSISPGLVTFVEAVRRGSAGDPLGHAQRLSSGVACLAISPSSRAASTQLRAASTRLADAFSASAHPMLVDVGSLVAGDPAADLVKRAQAMVWFVRPTAEEITLLRYRLDEISCPDNTVVAMIGREPYGSAEVEEALGVPVLQVIAEDRRGAAAVRSGGTVTRLRRSHLLRTTAELAHALSDQVDTWSDSTPVERDPLLRQA